MASISLPPQPQSTSAFSQHLDSAGRGRHRRNLSMAAPLPNPPFVFPARNPDDASAQNLEISEPKARTPPPLPAFSFNPGSTPSTQPSIQTLPSNRTGGHHRRISEFIGNEQLVTPGTVETDQCNDENSMPTTPAKLPAPGPGFGAGGNARRHAHRRSAAISGVDLKAISKALDTKPSTESAPSTPADAKQGNSAYDEVPSPVFYSATSLGRPTPPASPRITVDGNSTSHFKPEAADRVPLSPRMSVDSERTIIGPSENTARNSGTADPSATTRPLFLANDDKPKPRPKTADAFLAFDQSGSGDLSWMKRPLSSAGHSRFHKSMSSGILDVLGKKNHMSDGHLTDSSRQSSSTDRDSDTSMNDHELSESPKGLSKSKKRQKKVRSWAGAILTRGKGGKDKRHQSKKDPTEAQFTIPPPIITRTNSDLGSGLDVDFDDDSIVVIRTPTNPVTRKSSRLPPDADTQPSLENSWKPRSFYEQGSQDDVMSPVIDLDAALGPFNTPDMPSGKAAGGFSAATRRMYSGGRRGEFVGPEMRYHRRAESAPAPFDRSLFRVTNTSSLENPDVFYEEEEDAFLAATTESPKGSDETLPARALSSDVNETDNESLGSQDSPDTVIRECEDVKANIQPTGLGIQESKLPELSIPPIAGSEDQKGSQQQRAVDQLRNAMNPFSSQPKSPVEVIKQEYWQNQTPVAPSPDVSPRFLPADNRLATSSIELTTNIPQFSLQGGCSLPNSSFPSPDFTGSSSDAPRSITTPSTTDRKFSNPSYNPSLDGLHASVDDVPSLTSSASTMTNTLNRFSATFFQRPRLSTERSSSFSAAVERRSSHPLNQKRASLASLSKMVVSSHERSKLSHEEKPPSDVPGKTKKKGHKISRLMHFWRTKDRDKLNEDDQKQRPS